MLKKANNIIGAGLRPNVGISTAYAKAIVNELELMYRDIQRQLDKIAKSETYGQAMDASLASQYRIMLNALLRSYSPQPHSEGLYSSCNGRWASWCYSPQPHSEGLY